MKTSLLTLKDPWNLWIHNDGAISSTALLTKMNEMSGNGLFNMDDNLASGLATSGSCLGISYKKNSTNDKTNITLRTWNCEDKKSVTCKMDMTQSPIPPKPAKFPCITDTRDARKKRETQDLLVKNHDGMNKGVDEIGIVSKY